VAPHPAEPMMAKGHVLVTDARHRNGNTTRRVVYGTFFWVKGKTGMGGYSGRRGLVLKRSHVVAPGLNHPHGKPGERGTPAGASRGLEVPPGLATRGTRPGQVHVPGTIVTAG
jgi:hypothetical protein